VSRTSKAILGRGATPAHSRAFTLIEATLAIALLSLLVVGMGVAILTTASSAELGQGRSAQSVAAAAGLDELRNELASAVTIDKRTATGIAFTIPDRTGDGVAESIEYSWGGKPGDPLLRKINGGDARPVVAAADAVSFGFLIQPASVPTLTSTAMLTGFTGNIAIAAPNDAFKANYAVAEGWYPGTNATAARGVISKVTFNMRRDAATYGPGARLRVYTGDGKSPTAGTLLGTVSLTSAGVPTTKAYNDAEFVFSPALEFTSSTGLWFVLDAPGCLGNDYFVAIDLQTRTLNTRGYRAISGDAGANWVYIPSTSCSFRVFGSWKTIVFPQEALQ
jgi:hypothetical protein